MLLKHSFSVDFVLSSLEHKSKSECLKSLQPFVGCISNYMIRKIIQSGLAYCHFKLASNRGGLEGIENVILEKQSDVNVRNTKTIISKIATHFSI